MGVTENKFLVLFVSCLLLANAQNSDELISSKPRYDQFSQWTRVSGSYEAWEQSCIKTPPTGPKCRIQFVDDYYNPRNASCIEDNVFLIKSEERQITRTLRSWETKLRNQTYAEYIYDDKPPPYLKIECKSLTILDFQFDGVGALEYAGVGLRKIVYSKNVTYLLTATVLLIPEATGEYIIYSIDDSTNQRASFFVFSEREEKPYLLGGRRTLYASNVNDTSIRIPCVTTDPSVNVTLFKKYTNGSFVEILEADGLLRYDPKVGFLLNSTSQSEMDTEVDNYRCFTGADLPTTSTEYVEVKLGPLHKKFHALHIEVYNQSAVCYSNSSNSTRLTFTNVIARNPPTVQLSVNCLQRKHDHCGRTFSYPRREGQPGLDCPNNATSCLWITDLLPHGVVYCDAEEEIEPVWQSYFTGFDNTTYTEYRDEIPSNALIKLQWDDYPPGYPGTSESELVAGKTVYMQCKTVGMLFMTTEYPIVVKLKNGTTYEPPRRYTWSRSFDLLEDMKEVTCTNTLWSNTANISVSVGIEVKPKPVTCYGSYQFTCKTHLHFPRCISSRSKCDGYNDCSDGSDEEDCSYCSSLAFKCVNNRTCISVDKKCNHVLDCADGSDEDPDLCKSITCSSLSTRCQSGHCIDLHDLCDGIPDCLDKSDEDETHCSKHYPQFEQKSTAVTFVQGLYNHLVCGVTRNEFGLNSTIQWWRRGHVVVDTKRLWTSHSGLRVKLTFENISKDDSGEYTCIATNKLKSITQIYFVTVQESFTVVGTTKTTPVGGQSKVTTGAGVALEIFICLATLVFFVFAIWFLKKLCKILHSQTRSTQLVNDEALSLHNISSNGFIQ